MDKKISLLSGILLCCIFILVLLTFINYKSEACLDEYERIMNDKINLIQKSVDKYPIKGSGELEVVANYKGAHGENYPATFNYNYQVLDKIYFEDTHYSSIDNFTPVMNVFKTLKDLVKIDVKNYKHVSSSYKRIVLDYAPSYINDVIGTNFKNVSVQINTKGLIKKIKDIHIFIDDEEIIIKNDEINISPGNIHITMGDDSVYLNVKDKLKMNLFLQNGENNYSIVLNNQVFSVQLSAGGANIKLSSKSSIYNSMSINVTYKNVSLKRDNELENYEDNPIIRYINGLNLSL